MKEPMLKRVIGKYTTQRVLKLFPKGCVAIDLETTGLSSLCNKIIEVSAIKLHPDGSCSEYSTLVNPETPIPAKNTEIHGITDQDIKNAPKTNVALQELHQFIADLPIIAHNAQFDAGFIIFAFHALNLKPRNNPVYCSCLYSRKTIRDAKNHKLKTLAEHLSIPLENHHRAFDDAKAALQVFLESLERDPQHKKLKPAYIYNLNQFALKNIDYKNETITFLQEKLEENLPIMIYYTGGTVKNQWRAILPIGILPTPNGSVVYSNCLKSNLCKSFFIKKINKFRACTVEELKELEQAHA